MCEEEGRVTPDMIARYLKRYSKEEEIGCVFVDYLQLMTSGDGANRQEEVRSISRELKCLATDYKVPIIAACQLNREVEKRENKRPQMSDISESGGVEQDANIILLLYRQYHYDRLINRYAEDDGEAEIIVAKTRCGQTGTINCGFLPEIMKFYDLPGGIDEEKF